MCLATGLCAGGNYFNQPLLDEISQSLGVSSATAATSVTVAQVAYAVGLIFLTPLGDLMERRKLTVGLIGLTAVGQAMAGFAPAFGVFMIGIAVAGLFSVAAQVLVPYAAILAPPGRGGKAVGTVMSGLLTGVLLARAVAGILADLGGWTLIYHVAAVLMVLIGIGLWRVLPPSYPENPPNYLGLFSSMARLIRKHPRLRTRAMMSGISFASMSAIFATTTLLLAGEPFNLSPSVIGVVGLTGLAGALMASVGGGMVDRGARPPRHLLWHRGLGAGLGCVFSQRSQRDLVLRRHDSCRYWGATDSHHFHEHGVHLGPFRAESPEFGVHDRVLCGRCPGLRGRCLGVERGALARCVHRRGCDDGALCGHHVAGHSLGAARRRHRLTSWPQN